MDILIAIIAVVIPSVATYLALQISKGVLPFVDRLPGLIKQLLALVVAYVFSVISAKIGVPFPDSLAGLADPSVVAAILSGVVSWLLHKNVAAKLKAA